MGQDLLLQVISKEDDTLLAAGTLPIIGMALATPDLATTPTPVPLFERPPICRLEARPLRGHEVLAAIETIRCLGQLIDSALDVLFLDENCHAVRGIQHGVLLVYAPRTRRTTWQVAGLSAVGVLLAVAVVVRTLMLT